MLNRSAGSGNGNYITLGAWVKKSTPQLVMLNAMLNDNSANASS
jgi:hypothetical protein